MASAQSLTRSEAAFRVRAGEVGLTTDEIKKLFDHGISCLAKLASAACPPGHNPTDEQVNALFGGGLTIGSLASAKELIFESQTLVVAELKTVLIEAMTPRLCPWLPPSVTLGFSNNASA